MNYSSLFKPIQITKLESLEELQEKALKNQELIEYHPIQSKVTLSSEGKINTSIGSFPITKEGITFFLTKMLKVPDPFAKRIPFDLLQKNIERLSDLGDGWTAIIKNGTILNITEPGYLPVDLSNLFTPFSTMNQRHLEFSDLGIKIESTSGQLSSEPEVGDITHFGLKFGLSTTAFENINIRGFLYTLACTNGAVIPNALSKVKIKIKPSMDPQKIGEIIGYKIEQALNQGSKVLDRLTQLKEKPVPIKRLYSVIKSASKVAGIENVLSQYELDHEEFIELKNLSRDPNHFYDDSDFSYYSSYWKISNLSTQFLGTARSKLQILAGKHLIMEN